MNQKRKDKKRAKSFFSHCLSSFNSWFSVQCILFAHQCDFVLSHCVVKNYEIPTDDFHTHLGSCQIIYPGLWPRSTCFPTPLRAAGKSRDTLSNWLAETFLSHCKEFLINTLIAKQSILLSSVISSLLSDARARVIPLPYTTDVTVL